MGRLAFRRGAVEEEAGVHASEGVSDWVREARQLFDTADRERQQGWIHQMERHTRNRAEGLCRYHPIHFLAVNQAGECVPPKGPLLKMAETGVTEQHGSVRQSAKRE